MSPRKAIVLHSGGQDSTTCLGWAISEFGRENVIAVSFDYGQRHGVELDQAKRICELAAVPHTVLKVAGLPNSALTNDDIEVKADGGFKGLPSTFLPGRNAILLAYAAAFGVPQGYEHIVTGVCQTDYSGYPDCRAEFIDAQQKALSLALDTRLFIHAPLMYLTKGETVELANDLGIMHLIAESHTCYRGARPACGTCPSCLLRLKGFASAGLQDPIEYVPSP